MIKMVVFDMAGTTVDENNVVYKTLRQAINESHFDFTLDEVLKEGAGKEKQQAIRSVLALKQIADEKLAVRIFERFLVMLKDAYNDLDISEQPYTSEVFRTLKANGIAVALNTGYDRETAESLIRKIGWKLGHHFDCLVTASDVEQSRPDPEMINYAMIKMGIKEPGGVVKVGDSSIDIEEGQNAGCLLSIGITTGAHTRAQLQKANPDCIIDNLMELLPAISTPYATKMG